MTHTPMVSVVYNSPGWQQLMLSAINSRNFVLVRIKGSMASQARVKLENFAVVKVPAPPAQPVPVPYPQVAVSSFLTMAPALLSYFVLALATKGYKTVTATYDKRGAGTSDDELVLLLQ